MAESTNAIGFADLKQEVGRYLGYGPTSGNWSAAQESHIESIVNAGVRRVYFSSGHQWDWMRKPCAIPILEGVVYYDMPDDFGQFIGNLHYDDAVYQSPIVQTSAGDIHDYRCGSEFVQAPYCFATHFKITDGSTGSRQEMLVWPTPDRDYTVYGEYNVYTGKLSDTYPYPAGGAELTELYIESCLAVAEQKTGDAAGIHSQLFVGLLQAAIQRDKLRGPKVYGWMGHKESLNGRMEGEAYRRNSTIYYNGVEIV